MMMHDCALRFPHRLIEGSRLWKVLECGIVVEGERMPWRTVGEPVTMRAIASAWGAEIDTVAQRYGIPPTLIAATIATESKGAGAFNPTRSAEAVRHEPGYPSIDNEGKDHKWLNHHWREIDPDVIATHDSVRPDRVSVGCMQTLISTARAALDLPRIDRDWLMLPANSITAGAAYISQQRHKTCLDPILVCAAYNAGELRESDGNDWKLRSTGDHIDRFARWYGDACEVWRDRL